MLLFQMGDWSPIEKIMHKISIFIRKYLLIKDYSIENIYDIAEYLMIEFKTQAYSSKLSLKLKSKMRPGYDLTTHLLDLIYQSVVRLLFLLSKDLTIQEQNDFVSKKVRIFLSKQFRKSIAIFQYAFNSGEIQITNLVKKYISEVGKNIDKELISMISSILEEKIYKNTFVVQQKMKSNQIAFEKFIPLNELEYWKTTIYLDSIHQKNMANQQRFSFSYLKGSSEFQKKKLVQNFEKLKKLDNLNLHQKMLQFTLSNSLKLSNINKKSSQFILQSVSSNHSLNEIYLHSFLVPHFSNYLLFSSDFQKSLHLKEKYPRLLLFIEKELNQFETSLTRKF
ncbi:hypothetical protein M0811_11524 [Anaeramoeba ignava]|uniref:Uncharacterized protein n=1 Tax=Anaeramoeba ignava TaxID=1746090 RepID=A0A9Q0LBK6_ANAIG|nr:hypothetical protein M0811_11524 [Anaeramoeba ignava]